MGAIMDAVVWLRSLGLGKYEAAFREKSLTVARSSPVPDQDPERPKQPSAGCEEWANDLVA